MKKEFIKKMKGTIYHELGHLFGYVIANKNSKTKLGEVQVIYLGNRNFVISKKNLYHRDNNTQTFDNFQLQIYNNTENIERTIAWFIEVVLGCTFQTLFEKKDFSVCFRYEGIGGIDFRNIIDIKSISYFKWNYPQIFAIQKKISDLIVKYRILEKSKPIIESIETKLISCDLDIFELKDNALEKLSSDISEIIPKKMLDEYLNIVLEYTEIFKQTVANKKYT